MRLLIEHRTRYSFTLPQRRLVQLLRVTPLSFFGQSVVDWQIDVDCNARLKSGRDGFGNETTMLYIDGPTDTIAVTVRGEVLTQDRAGIVTGALEPLPPELYTRSTALTQPSDAIADFARGFLDAAKSPLSAMHAIMGGLNERIRFDAGTGDVTRGAIQAFEEKSGVCQDHAHLMIASARSLGIPARYVSGHLWRSDQPKGSVQAATHAWAEVWLADYGWVAFDAANDHCPDEAYVRVAIGLDYRDAAPLSGARVGGGDERLDVEVRVDRADAAPTMR